MIPFHLFDLKRFLTSSYIMILYFISKSSLKSMYTHQKKKKVSKLLIHKWLSKYNTWEKICSANLQEIYIIVPWSTECNFFPHSNLSTGFKGENKKERYHELLHFLNCQNFKKYNENEFIENVLSCFLT